MKLHDRADVVRGPIIGRNVVVVGGAGFLGSHLVDHLIEDRHCNVLVLDNLVAGRREFVHKEAAFEHWDITGPEDGTRGIFKRFGAEYVLNYAAHPYVPMSYDRPLFVFNTNAMGAMKVVNAAMEAGCHGVLQVSSAELYGEGGNDYGDDRIDEDAPVSPHSSYGAAKAAVDYYCQAAWKERGTRVIALRQFNCVGERETHPYVVPEIIGQLARGYDPVARPLRLGNNSARDFLYAGDAVRAAVQLLEKGAWGGVYNLGSETAVTIHDLAQMLGDVMGCGRVMIETDPARVRPWEIWRLQSDNALIRDALGPTNVLERLVPLREALERTVDWFFQQGRQWPWERRA